MLRRRCTAAAGSQGPLVVSLSAWRLVAATVVLLLCCDCCARRRIAETNSRSGIGSVLLTARGHTPFFGNTKTNDNHHHDAAAGNWKKSCAAAAPTTGKDQEMMVAASAHAHAHSPRLQQRAAPRGASTAGAPPSYEMTGLLLPWPLSGLPTRAGGGKAFAEARSCLLLPTEAGCPSLGRGKRSGGRCTTGGAGGTTEPAFGYAAPRDDRPSAAAARGRLQSRFGRPPPSLDP